MVPFPVRGSLSSLSEMPASRRCLALILLLGPGVRCFRVPHALTDAPAGASVRAAASLARRAARGTRGSVAPRGLRARAAAAGAPGGGCEIDQDALLPLEAAASPRQAEMHRRRRECAMHELQRHFDERIAAVTPSLLEALDAGPGAVAVADNVLGPEWCEAMRREAIAVTERGLMKGTLARPFRCVLNMRGLVAGGPDPPAHARSPSLCLYLPLCLSLPGSASAYSTAPAETFEERYGDEPGIAATVLPPSSVAGDLSPRCNAYIEAASRRLASALSGARRGPLEPTEGPGRPTDHQLRLTTVAQQVHMDNSFDGVNRRLLTTIYYLNPSWQPEHGGRFIPWPCDDAAAAEGARTATLASTMLKFDDLPADAQKQIPQNKRCVCAGEFLP